LKDVKGASEILLWVQSKQKGENTHDTFWSPPPVAKRRPPGWMSMEKICSPSWRIQVGFSVIISS